MVILPFIHRHTIWLDFRCTRRRENQVTRCELLDDIDCVRVAITRHHVFRCIENLEDDVACRTDTDVNPQFQNVIRTFVEALHRFAHGPSFQIQRERTRILGRRHGNLEVLGHGLSGVKADHQWEVDLPTPRQQPFLLTLQRCGVIESKGVEHVARIGNRNRENRSLALLDIRLVMARL